MVQCYTVEIFLQKGPLFIAIGILLVPWKTPFIFLYLAWSIGCCAKEGVRNTHVSFPFFVIGPNH